MANEDASPKSGLVSNILAVAGFIILIAIVVWGAFHFLNIASSGFSSLFNRNSGNTITVTLSNRTVNSGQPLDVSWKYTPANGGSYAVLYQCKDNFQFRGINAAGVVTGIPCGSPYTVGDSSAKSVRLVPVLGGATATDIPFSIVYSSQAATSTGTTTGQATRAQGNATVTVSPQAGGVSIATSTLPATGTGSSQTGTVNTVPGKPDLMVRILAVGVIDGYSGMFVQRAPQGPNDIMAVKFDIANVGTGASGTWYFSAQLPTSPTAPYVSSAQRSLGRGDHIENTLRFNQVAPGGGNFTVTVDPSNAVGELSESNNYASEWVQGGIGGYPYGTQYPGSPYYPYQY
ncbi:hypothetical protein HY969_05010 [Candidatus Kaiserbacteria bacterium]|nr:hypothetical protein [Candidatus Kaiserbacteria bacterium]